MNFEFSPNIPMKCDKNPTSDSVSVEIEQDWVGFELLKFG
jgi:hypothetical protein